MGTSTVRIPDDKRDKLKILASIEKRQMKDILSELIDEYIERHKETLELLSNPEWVEMIEAGKAEVLELLSNPEWVEMIEAGKAEVTQNIKGKSLAELED